MQTRLQRKSERRGKQIILLLLIGSLVLLGSFLYFGVPALFGLAGTISSLGKTGSMVEEDDAVLNPPSLTREFEATKSAEISITGLSDPDAEVELLRNSISVGVEKADKSGAFSFDDVSLEKGKNEFIAVTVSNMGRKSDPSGAYVVFYSTSGPKMELINKDGDVVKESPYTFTGKVDPVDAQVYVNDRLAIVDSKGNFSYYLTLNNGDNKITVVAKDGAGNETKQELTLKFEL